MTNRLTLLIWVVQLIVCLIGGICATVIANSPEYVNRRYLLLNDEANKLHPVVAGIVSFLTWVVLTCNFVPISLIVTMGMVKAVQAYFIMIDVDMYNATTNTYACPRTSDLNEELGLVEYVFSDKTGTLTSNVMEFRKCFVNGFDYGKGLTEICRQILLKSHQVVPFEPKPDPNEIITPHVNFVDDTIREHIMDASHNNHVALIDFFLHLSVNHSVVPELDDSGGVRYSASSPDEGALVYGAKHFGVEFKTRTPYGVEVSVLGRLIHVDVLATVEFTSSRKRSSMLCKIPKNDGGDRIVLFCKGADSVIQNRLKSFGTNEEKTFEAMESYALDGLRTLCIAKKDLSVEEFGAWFHEYEKAAMSLENRDDKIEAVAEKIETDLILQGVTGIEDRLQEGVGDTVESLRRAGIHVWMLTGDKIETAINIGIATSLLTHDMQQHIFESDGSNYKDTKALLERLQEIIASNHEDPTSKHATIIDGETLGEMLTEELEKYFMDVCKYCETVICSRVTPHQKGAVVSLVKKYENKITLAIGDGANDCNMIQSAHVGIGLRGQEGLQAFNTSDYGLSQFSFLKNLLLVHGRWSYRRITKLVLYIFYKNMVLVMPIFYFGILSLFSGQKIYYEFLYQMYNVVFTSIPIIIYGTLDQDVDKRTSLKYPCLYRLGHQSYYFNNFIFLQWIANGIWHATVVFILPLYGLAYFKIPTSNGRPFDIWMIGLVIFTSTMLIVNIKVLLETYYLTWIPLLGVIVSMLGFIFFVFLFSSWPNLAGTVLGEIFILGSSAYFWICIFLSVILALGRDWLWKCVKRNFFPEIYHYIQQNEYGKKSAKVTTVAGKNLLSSHTPSSGIRSLAHSTLEKTPERGKSFGSQSMTSQRGFAFSEADAAAVRLVREESFVRSEMDESVIDSKTSKKKRKNMKFTD